MLFGLYYLNIMFYAILIPGFILTGIAQVYVKTTYRKYSRVGTKKGKTAYEVSRDILNGYHCDDVEIREIAGELTDNYNPQNKTLNLSTSVSDFNSIAAVGVAAHECGHAVQDHKGSIFFTLRKILVPVTNIGSMIAIPLVILGIILEYALAKSSYGEYIVLAGIICYSLSVVFCLITLPVEIGASVRAKRMLLKLDEVDEVEARGVSKVLTSAAMTYVAALFLSLLYLLRFVLIIAMFAKKKND